MSKWVFPIEKYNGLMYARKTQAEKTNYTGYA